MDPEENRKSHFILTVIVMLAFAAFLVWEAYNELAAGQGLSLPSVLTGPAGTRPGTSGTLYLFSGNSHEKNVQEKDPGNTWQCAGCAGNGPGT